MYRSANGIYQRAEVYAGGMHVATYNNSTTYFDHTDWTGTERARSDVNGMSFETCGSLPYGDAQDCTGSLDASPLHFTGKQRDLETGLDYFNARYYASTSGRFLLPDWSAVPVAIPYADLSNPQTLNLYTYVGNNPITHTDVDGHQTASGQNCGGEVGAPPGDPILTFSPNKNNAPPCMPSAFPYSADNGEMAQQMNDNAENSIGQLAHQANQVSASVNGASVTYTYPDGSTIVRSGTHPWRDNNPGDLISGHGSIGRDAGGGNVMAIYPSESAGWSALGQTLIGKYGGQSIADTMTQFAPASDGNNPAKYAATLASAVGVSVSTKISALSPAQLVTIEINIARAEGYFSKKNSISYTSPQ